MASILPQKVFEATGIKPFVGQLSHPGDLDKDNDIIVDSLPLDYSILEEIDYKYPTSDAYFTYMTRGCVNNCAFCAVPKLEPEYRDYIGIKEQIRITDERFGTKRDLLLLDNNVLASNCYEKIIDEIVECGFGRGASYVPSDEYAIIIKNLQNHYNDRAYIKKAVNLYHTLLDKVKDKDKRAQLYALLEKHHCLHFYTASVEDILSLDEFVRPLNDIYLKPHLKRKRIVDFNQGVDSRLINHLNMKKLASVNIFPLRIAFDHWELKDVYEKSVRQAVSCGIKNLSNYLLYNFKDKPEDLYNRLRLNVDLCEELGATIYSFPMKYHPIDDPLYFRNRDYIGVHWNRKFIRAIQAVLNSTKGKVGKGIDFFEEAFGCDVNEFYKILWMPETFIIYRRKYDKNLRVKLADRYQSKTNDDCDLANEWWEKFCSLSVQESEFVKKIIAKNNFNKDSYLGCTNEKILAVLRYYEISRDS